MTVTVSLDLTMDGATRFIEAIHGMCSSHDMVSGEGTFNERMDEAKDIFDRSQTVLGEVLSEVEGKDFLGATIGPGL